MIASADGYRRRSPSSRACLIAAPLVLAVLAVAGWRVLPAAAAVRDETSSAKLSALILRAAQVGNGYRKQSFGEGDQVEGQVTLDLCGQEFPSEQLRTARLQLGYVHPGENAVWVSNEVVRYRPGGARQALDELIAAVRDCPRGSVIGQVQGVGPVTYRIKRIKGKDLLPEHLALQVHVRGLIDDEQVDFTMVLVYQIRGDVLSGVYAHDGTLTARRRIALHAAAQSARNLRSRLPG